MKKISACGIIVLSGLAAWAVPVVKNVTFVQSASSRAVTIGYSLSEPAIVTVDVLTNAVDAASGASIGSGNLGFMSGAVNKRVPAGDHEVLWRPDKAWPDRKIDDQSVRVKVTAWALDNPPDVMVVNLVRADAASAYDVTYFTSLENLPGGLLKNTEYRTSKLVMKRVRAPECGTYVMGNLKEAGHRSDECQHTVVLTNDYYLGVFEITQSQYMHIVGAYPGSHFTVQRDMRPAEKVSYTAFRGGTWPASPTATSFVGLVAGRTGYAFDLPSETQFEYACRAGNYEGFWPDGSSIDPTVSNVKDSEEASLSRQARYIINAYFPDGSDDGTDLDEPPGTVPPAEGGTALVGSYEPNAWGFYDMLGNVDEFCLDFYKADTFSEDGRVVDASRADDATKIVVRGACYWDQWYNARSSRRAAISVSSSATKTHGCRLACPIVPVEE